MSSIEKLVKRFLSKPKDFSWKELIKIMKYYGYDENNKGKTSGSRVSFVNPKNSHIISLHKPHPTNILKEYQINLLVLELKNRGILK